MCGLWQVEWWVLPFVAWVFFSGRGVSHKAVLACGGRCVWDSARAYGRVDGVCVCVEGMRAWLLVVFVFWVCGCQCVEGEVVR